MHARRRPLKPEPARRVPESARDRANCFGTDHESWSTTPDEQVSALDLPQSPWGSALDPRVELRAEREA